MRAHHTFRRPALFYYFVMCIAVGFWSVSLGKDENQASGVVRYVGHITAKVRRPKCIVDICCVEKASLWQCGPLFIEEFDTGYPGVSGNNTLQPMVWLWLYFDA